MERGVNLNAPTPFFMEPRLHIIQADITTLEVDAIVNAGNSTLMGGGGVDGAIHRKAGPQLLEACRPLNGCRTGEAKITSGFNLPADFVIHTVGPVWYGSERNERELLASCYRKSLELAVENNLRTVAFPSISTGAFGFPFHEASTIAINTVLEELSQHPQLEQVTLVAFGEGDYNQLKKIFKKVTSTNS